MSIINIRLEINTEDFYKIKLNDQPIVEHTQSTIEFTSPILKDHKFSWLDIQGKVTIESLTLDKGSAHLKDEIMPRYAELIYNGFWFSPEREMLQALINKSQTHVSGNVVVSLYKGNIQILSRSSKNSLYSNEMATFEEDNKYDQKDADGFIKLNALRLKLLKHRT